MREIFEEVGITAKSLNKHSVTLFEFTGNPELLEVHIYSTTSFDGEPNESEEMMPQWFLKNDIPFEKMWADDKHWLPKLLNGECWNAHILFDESGKEVLAVEFKEFFSSHESIL